MIGQTLSHYRITAALGAGGMGEVYRATDTNLGRDVAIKVLPPEVTEDPERLGRFKREAHLLAALNHPHIAAIYGLEEADGKPFLALELVEGEDLKERLERGAIAVDEALEMAKEIAEALEEAHNKGIVHRDLKPANVKLTPDGKVKVLDFGLAKAWAVEAPDGSSSSAALSQSPTMANTGTVAGLILGTAAYMSPEQARGRPVDKRADVWSFGVLLWEMLTGRTLFAGDTVTDVIAAVVTKEPDLDVLPEGTPKAVRRLLSRCLRKDRRSRLPDMGAARLELEDVLGGAEAEGDPSVTDAEKATRVEHRRRKRERVVWAALAVILGGLSALLVAQRLTDVQEPRHAVHFVLDAGDDLALGEFGVPAISPDGLYVAYSSTSGDASPRLRIRPLDSPQARALPGTERSGQAPFWSADGEALAFSAEGSLKKVSLASGTVQRICALPEEGFFGGTWNEEGTIVFSTGGTSASLFSVSASGGEPKVLSAHDESRGETGHYWPRFLPDGRRLVFDVRGAESGVYLASLDALDERVRLVPGGGPAAVASGHLLSVQDGILLAHPFDSPRGEVTGEPTPVVEGVATWPGIATWGWFSASAGRTLAYREGGGTEVQLVWRDRGGRRLGTVGDPGAFGQIALSPDERRVVVEIGDSQSYDLWVIDVARGVARRATTSPADERDPIWSPDSQQLAYATNENGDQNILRQSLSGGEPSPLPGGAGATAGVRDIPDSWASEGDTLVYLAKGERHAIWTVPVQEGGEAELVVESEFTLDEAQLSPDRRWLAYLSNESGAYEVYVKRFLRPGETVRVSANGGGQPRWRADGKELFYVAPDGHLLAVDVGEGARGPEVGLPTSLFRVGVLSPDYDDYAVSRDGQRFLVKAPVGEARGSGDRIHVVTNWTSLLE